MITRTRLRQGWAFDPRWCHIANRWGAHRSLHRLFTLVSRLGDGWLWLALAAGLAALPGSRGIWAALQMLVTGAVGSLVYRVLKQMTRRSRPYRIHATVVARVTPLDEYSFPSGHTLHAVCFSIVAGAWFPMLALPLIVFTVLVALSRLVLGLHYPTDVLAGALLGTVIALLSLYLVPVIPR
ncbi:MAG: phosphatase PAP2 family protein [Rhodanobacter sp.]|nr:MAG: phosphatase PAP2 family protein [Rhodanobacter sp.]TAM12107.1 MAG: phosphatase PAP2 family protein [Rhodanobacter sp.]TAM34552.1 MAG: phosphatase PAP2 family protein [Rhodanobacter sp.]